VIISISVIDIFHDFSDRQNSGINPRVAGKSPAGAGQCLVSDPAPRDNAGLGDPAPREYAWLGDPAPRETRVDAYASCWDAYKSLLDVYISRLDVYT